MSGAVAYVRGIIPDAENRERDDFYPTPPRATLALLGAEPFEGGIWEPACGDGAISRVLEAAGHEVLSSDLIDRGYGIVGRDFLLDWQTMADNIVTNPPFKHAQEFVEHALRRSRRKVAMLCRLAWLEGKERGKMFRSTPLARVLVFSSRVPMLRNGDQMMAGGGGMIAFAWYAQAAFLATPCKGTAEAYRQRAFYFWRALTGSSVGWETELAFLDTQIERAIQLHEMRTGRAAE